MYVCVYVCMQKLKAKYEMRLWLN
jgi:hypothetical protein